jgi:hypothetical protein
MGYGNEWMEYWGLFVEFSINAVQWLVLLAALVTAVICTRRRTGALAGWVLTAGFGGLAFFGLLQAIVWFLLRRGMIDYDIGQWINPGLAFIDGLCLLVVAIALALFRVRPTGEGLPSEVRRG